MPTRKTGLSSCVTKQELPLMDSAFRSELNCSPMSLGETTVPMRDGSMLQNRKQAMRNKDLLLKTMKDNVTFHLNARKKKYRDDIFHHNEHSVL